MAKEIKATYEMIRGYKFRPTNEYLALSEFVDNSIASYQKNNRSNAIKGLNVSITFDDRDPKNAKLIISDNANGMDGRELENAMQPSDREGKSGTQYNQYGVGMKLGIFWYGENVTIYSKKPNDDEYKLSLITEGKQNTKENLIVSAELSNDGAIKYQSGTTVIIEKIYHDRNPIYRKDCINKIVDALEWRYSKLLNLGMMINLVVRSSDNKKNQEYIIRPFKRKYFTREQLFEEKNSKSKWKTINQKIEHYNKKLEELYKEISDKERQGKDIDIILEAYNKINKDEDVVLERDIEINGKYVKLRFGIIDIHTANKNRYSGVTIYHLDRAIVHGPNDNYKGAYQFVTIAPGTSGDKIQYRYLIGDLDLTGIEEPDENKSKFLWSETGEEDLKKALDKIFNDLKPILDIITKITDIEDNPGLTKKESPIVLAGIKDKFPIAFETFESSVNDYDELGYKGTVPIFDELYNVEIYETNKNKLIENKFIHVERDEETKSLKIWIESNNEFWKPLIVSNNDFKGQFLYEIALIFGVSHLIYGNDLLLDKIDPKREMTYSNIVTDLIGSWKCRDK